MTPNFSEIRMQQTTRQTCDLLITADILLTQDADRRVIEDAAVAIKNGKVSALGSRSGLAHILAKDHLHLRRSLLMPASSTRTRMSP